MAEWDDMEAELMGSWDALADGLLLDAEADPEADEARHGEDVQPQALEPAAPKLQKPQVSSAILQVVSNTLQIPSQRPSFAQVCADAVQWALNSDNLVALDPFVEKLSAFFARAKQRCMCPRRPLLDS